MKISLEYQGKTYQDFTAEELAGKGVPAENITAAIAAIEAIKQRDAMRTTIEDKAGDVPSLLGTTADATQLLLFGLASLVGKLATANSLAEMREAAQPFAEISGDFLSKVESGDVKLPFMIKGTENVIADIEGRSTAVADTLLTLAQSSDAAG